MDLERLLASVGKKIFIKYYYNFKYKSTKDCIYLIEEDYTEKSKRSRTSHAKKIFNENKQLEALKTIKNSRVDDDTKRRVIEITKKEIAQKT